MVDATQKQGNIPAFFSYSGKQSGASFSLGILQNVILTLACGV